MAIKYSEWPKIYQYFPVQSLPKFTQIGRKINHLANLAEATFTVEWQLLFYRRKPFLKTWKPFLSFSFILVQGYLGSTL
jgi:hypothetical protein